MEYHSRVSVAWIVSIASSLLAIGTASAQPAACNLFAREVVEQALGASIGAAREGVNHGTVTSCLFPVNRGGSVTVLFRRNAERAWITEQEQRMDLGIRYGNYRAVAGLGEQAYLLDRKAAGAAVCVFGADYYLQISVFHAGDAARVLPGIERLIWAALARVESLPAGRTALARRTR